MVKMNMLSKLKSGKSSSGRSNSNSSGGLDDATHCHSSRQRSSKDVKMTDAHADSSSKVGQAAHPGVDGSNRSGGGSGKISSSKTGTSSRSKSGALFQFLEPSCGRLSLTSPYHRVHLIFANVWAMMNPLAQYTIPPQNFVRNLLPAPQSILQTRRWNDRHEVQEIQPSSNPRGAG